MDNKKVIYLRGKLTDHCPRQQFPEQEQSLGARSGSQKQEREHTVTAAFYGIRDHT